MARFDYDGDRVDTALAPIQFATLAGIPTLTAGDFAAILV